MCVRVCARSARAEVARAQTFLAALKEKRARLGEEVYLVVCAECVSLQLKRAGALASAAGGASTPEVVALLDDAKKELEAVKALLGGLPEGVEPTVPAAVHRASAEYFKLRGPAHLFYEAALLWLGCTPLEELPAGVRAGLAVDVALAALVGEGVFNFGEGEWAGPQWRSGGVRV